MHCCSVVCVFFFFKQKTAYEMRISDWSSDVCSSDLLASLRARVAELVDEVMGRAETARRMDVLADLTQPVAFGFLTRFLGVADTDAKRFFSWSHAVAQFMLQPHAEEAAVRRGVERSEESRVGKEGYRTCRSRGSP